MLFIHSNRNELKNVLSTDALCKQEWAFTSESMKRLMRLKHLSYRTEQTYLAWLRDFYVFIKPLPPSKLEADHLKHYLTYLAVDRHVAKSTQNLAFNALLFFYRHVIEKEVGPLSDVIRSCRGQHLPTVLTIADGNAII